MVSRDIDTPKINEFGDKFLFAMKSKARQGRIWDKLLLEKGWVFNMGNNQIRTFRDFYKNNEITS